MSLSWQAVAALGMILVVGIGGAVTASAFGDSNLAALILTFTAGISSGLFINPKAA